MAAPLPPVPVTIVTGFLGAGKSTLLNYILTERHGLRIAVIENEFSEDVGIESLILKNGLGGKGSEDFFELSNGCLCCTMRDDLVATLDRLMAQRHRFDYVLIETSGLADPGPVAAAFWADSGESLVLDGIVCVADGGRIAGQVGEARAPGTVNEAARQVAYADVVLLNKEDTLAPEALAGARGCVGVINAAAKILTATRCRVDLAELLHLGALSPLRAQLGGLEAALPQVGGGSTSCSSSCCSPSSGSGCTAPHHTHQHAHDSGISTVLLRCGAVSREAFRLWVASLLWVEEGEGERGGSGGGGGSGAGGQRILRGKGVLALGKGGEEGAAGGVERRKTIFQSVEEFFDVEEAQEGSEGAEWGAGEAAESRVILIGWKLDKGALQRGLLQCQAAPASPGASL